MKKLLIVAVVFGAALVSCQGSKNAKSFSSLDSLSYAVGMDLALHSGVRGVEDSTLNVNILAAAIRDAWNGNTQISEEDAKAFIGEWFEIRVPARAAAANKEWLDKVKAENPNIQTTASGLMYEILSAGDQAVKAVNDADQVVVDYALSIRDGDVVQQRDSISFALNRVIPAWTEGMKLVGKGGKIVLWAPAELGYGSRTSGSIPANSALKFEVRLIDVIPAAR